MAGSIMAWGVVWYWGKRTSKELTERPDGVFVPQERPLDGRKVRVTEIGRRFAPWVEDGGRFQGGIPPEGITGYGRDWETWGWVKKVTDKALTWVESSASVDWLTSIVKGDLRRAGSECTSLKVKQTSNKKLRYIEDTNLYF